MLALLRDDMQKFDGWLRYEVIRGWCAMCQILWLRECRLLGCGSTWVCYRPTFRRNVSPTLFLSRINFSTLRATCSSETSVYNKSTQRHIPEDIFILTTMKISNPTLWLRSFHYCFVQGAAR
jgi:hypothetical protein